VLVTGGTGCIGRVLLNQLIPYRPARLVSLSRGRTALPRIDGVEFVYGDVRYRSGLDEVFERDPPGRRLPRRGAAQPGPGRGRGAAHRGHQRLRHRQRGRGGREAGAGAVICASTGKALRPYSPDVYAASKRIGEWVLARAAATLDIRLAASRFTHVVDNSIIGDRLRAWCAKDEPIRLHSAEIGFYIQSALESAQLLLCGLVDAQPGHFRLNALRDLDWPASLLEVALGAIEQTGSAAPIYIAGYD
jgi:nucleoside-diphosphate-sugar epimerase